MYTLKDLANKIFPDVTMTLDDLERKYPPRNLGDNCEVTRFAPSPTGFLHTGSLFTSLVAQKVANQSNGIFYIRLEDTDTKREVEGSGKDLIDQLKVFGVIPNEGYLGDHEEGDYGPYKQSDRAEIYKVVIKHLIEIGRAYPCFCSHEELDSLRNEQEKNKIIPGYYGKYAKCRFYSIDEQMQLINEGKPYVIRFKSMGNHENKIEVYDLIRKKLLLSENDQDIVILKSDGLPTYHFAHLVDDHFMRTTCVTRGEEWLPSLPLHIELFKTMNWQTPKYAHLPVIMKLDNGNRRKLSKRKDNEAACSYFLKDGYPVEAFKQYLFTIANSNYEEWQLQNRDLTLNDFNFSFDKMSLDGALFDIDKLKYFSKELLGSFSGHELKERVKEYSSKYNQELYELIMRDENYFEEIMSIEKDKENPRKDYEKYSDVFEKIKFFYEPYFSTLISNGINFNEKYDKKIIMDVLNDFVQTLDYSKSEQEWFNSLKELALRHNFADSNKVYKQNKELYLGSVNDIAEMVRIALTTSKQSPNIYYILKILKKDEIARRINLIINQL